MIIHKLYNLVANQSINRASERTTWQVEREVVNKNHKLYVSILNGMKRKISWLTSVMQKLSILAAPNRAIQRFDDVDVKFIFKSHSLLTTLDAYRLTGLRLVTKLEVLESFMTSLF